MLNHSLISSYYGYNDRVLRDAQDSVASNRQDDKEWLHTVVIPYRKTISENIRRILNLYNIKVAFQATNKLHKQLVKLKDPLTSLERSNCVYKLKCKDCNMCYIWQTTRELGARVKEHRRCATKLPVDVNSMKK